MARLENVGVCPNKTPKGSLQIVLDEATLVLPIADIINLDQERERLQKQIAKLEAEIKKIEQKLKNKNFIANAPEEIVDEQKSRKSDAQNTMKKISQALKQLDAA